jgi:hypothetical protein
MTQRLKACPSSAAAKKFHLIGLLCTYNVHAQMDTMNLAPAANITLLTFSDSSVVRFKACMQSVYSTILA